ncbi:MAG: zinc ribbon domain-containing protein [Alphaproteobacteria bacterium]|nr:zinc ribbon domain-containing protein [Alphaproteobacteria bacterium]
MLIECRECRNKVSTTARFCPHCGARFFAYPRWRRWIIYAALFAVLAIWFDPIVRYGYWGAKQAIAYVVNIWASGGP